MFFNSPGQKPTRKSCDEIIHDLRNKNLLLQSTFKAKRAFQVEEFDDEGSHYFIELEDGNVLYLNGQYLYDYEPIEDDPEFNQERSFPCTEFTILRHKTEDYVLKIETGGKVLEPEVLTSSFTISDYKKGIAPEDGQLIKDRSYDQIKNERTTCST